MHLNPSLVNSNGFDLILMNTAMITFAGMVKFHSLHQRLCKFTKL